METAAAEKITGNNYYFHLIKHHRKSITYNEILRLFGLLNLLTPFLSLTLFCFSFRRFDPVDATIDRHTARDVTFDFYILPIIKLLLLLLTTFCAFFFVFFLVSLPSYMWKWNCKWTIWTTTTKLKWLRYTPCKSMRRAAKMYQVLWYS